MSMKPRFGGAFYYANMGVPEVLGISGFFNGLQKSGTEKHVL